MKRPKLTPKRRGEKSNYDSNVAKQKIHLLSRIAAYELSKLSDIQAQLFNHAASIIMNSMRQSVKPPVSSKLYQDAVYDQNLNTKEKILLYKRYANDVITGTELLLSGLSLFGAYTNWRNWNAASNIYKRGIANILQKAQMPFLVGGVIIDGSQVYNDLQNGNTNSAIYNGISAAAGSAGAIGASDVFRNYYNSPKLDMMLDATGVTLNAGDFFKFGYDRFNKHTK